MMGKWKKINKTSEVLKYLEENGSIDSLTAIEKFGATRLSAIIYNLRNRYDMNIINETIDFVDRYGNHSSFAKYIYVKDDENEAKNS